MVLAEIHLRSVAIACDGVVRGRLAHLGRVDVADGDLDLCHVMLLLVGVLLSRCNLHEVACTVTPSVQLLPQGN
ncbi:hypothetical protein CPT_Sitrop_025 [Streptomyces phage Sitrop]|uniref:Uncharacterized protein n=1 Tax=Streptomyces phage Sitrop TaxID=2767587 RepID=A0A873WES8_9CAUD|nr:hypothetical protein KGG96_gp25 [Streptomyces phage Sitrop]QPB09940.1 hypothetical protein CPT_Sitrop_025 [Streptomyces phage Sitrop]